MLSSREKGVQYSLQQELTSSSLKNGDFHVLPDTKRVEQRMYDRQILVQLADDASYHHKFHNISGKPYIIYYQGNIDLLSRDLLAVVGPRESSVYAEQVVGDLFEELRRYDLVTLSGGARGIDMLCHTLSLRYQIPTIVVLGAGFAEYLSNPRTQDILAEVVVQGGLILSQFKIFQRSDDRTYPARNKIIAGLAKMVFVPAAGQHSGTLVTVDFALQMGTPVYSVPANIYDATSYGTNLYIQEGKIRPVGMFETMLANHFSLAGQSSAKEPPVHELTEQEKEVVTLLATGPQPIENICEQLGWPIEQVMSCVAALELEEVLHEPELGVYALRR